MLLSSVLLQAAAGAAIGKLVFAMQNTDHRRKE